MNKLICKNCGHAKLNMGNIDEERCELCGNIMTCNDEKSEIEQLVREDKDYYTIDEIVDKDLVERMTETIKDLGHKKCWEIIERITTAETRLKYRQLFIKAGGVVT